VGGADIKEAAFWRDGESVRSIGIGGKEADREFALDARVIRGRTEAHQRDPIGRFGRHPYEIIRSGRTKR
jgi:hypothetical protein